MTIRKFNFITLTKHWIGIDPQSINIRKMFRDVNFRIWLNLQKEYIWKTINVTGEIRQYISEEYRVIITED